MSFWNSIFFNNANSPLMEQMIFFHDHSMIIIMMIIICILYIISFILTNKINFLMFNENHFLEIIWTMIPSFLLIFIAFPSLRLLYISEENFYPSITIKIMGHQWYWSYELSDFNKEFDSFILSENMNYYFRNLDVDNNLIIPFNNNIKLMISSFDVIHAWTIPSLGIKMDAIPGRLNQFSMISLQPGLFYGQCSEICGANHSFMPICLEITSIKNFINSI